MNDKLKTILTLLATEYKDEVSRNGRNYVEVDLGNKAEIMGFQDVKEQFRGANAVIPLKIPMRGMKVRIDGRTFVDYGQFDSGIAVPGYVAREAGLPYKKYFPNDSMILNFA